MPPRKLAPKTPKIPRLPVLFGQKLYKTGQTRGADDAVIFQNRVARNSTVLIPYAQWGKASLPPDRETTFENGFIALLTPAYYFATPSIDSELAAYNLQLGINALVVYEAREEWQQYPPASKGWTVANSRVSPLGGQYIARVPATTAIDGGDKISQGFTTREGKGAGIRVYEYASTKTIGDCRMQLEFLFWQCADALQIAASQGMTAADITTRKEYNAEECTPDDLSDLTRLRERRLINDVGRTVCPLCLEELSAAGFFNKVEQAEGRFVHGLTVTQLNLFHIDELRIGSFGHRPYNVGWGHHHCNVVVKDAGIAQTLTWMNTVIDRNIAAGYLLRGE